MNCDWLLRWLTFEAQELNEEVLTRQMNWLWFSQLQMRLNRSSQIRFRIVRNIRHYVSSAAATVEHDVCARSRTVLLTVIGWLGQRGFTLLLCIEKACVIFILFSGPTSSVFYNAAFFIGDSGQASCVLVNDVQIAQNKNHRHREDGGEHQWDADS